LDLHGLLKTGIIVGLSGADRRIGFPRALCKEKISAWFTNTKGPRTGIGPHVVELNHSLAKLAGAGDLSPAPLPFQVPQAAEEKIDDFMKNQSDLSGKPLVAINPGAGFESKQWEIIRFAKLADKIVQDLGYEVILTWGPGEEGKVATIAEKMEQSSVIAPATTVVESIALYNRLNLMVSCDSGPLHLCAGLGIPTVSIFGPTDPERNGAYGPNHEVVCKILPCSYCWKRRCPLGTRECMDSVLVDDVFSAVKTCASKYMHAQDTAESSTIINKE
jgi:ADP-heptose:LPS heptosyltransferase